MQAHAFANKATWAVIFEPGNVKVTEIGNGSTLIFSSASLDSFWLCDIHAPVGADIDNMLGLAPP
jgi:hypothetical protein